jgi:hypothetical protein
LPEPPTGLGPSLGLDVLVDRVGRHDLWVSPYDPDLMSLPEAVSGAAIQPSLRAAGLLDGPALVHARLIRYRPGRRAVVRYQVVPRPERGGRPRALRSGEALFDRDRFGREQVGRERFGSEQPGHERFGRDRTDTVLYGKVLRADRAARVRLLARALAPGRRYWGASTDALDDGRPDAKRFRSPTDGGWWRGADLRLAIPSPLDNGLFVTPAIGGRSLRELLLGGDPLPAPARVVSALVALSRFQPPGDVLAPSERRHPARQLDYAVAVLGHVLPHRADDLSRVADVLVEDVAGWEPTGFAHGDLYDDQVYVDERYGIGFIDLDDMGPGDPAMDAGNACAHLLALAAAVPRHAHRLVAYRELLRGAFIERLGVSPAELAWRETLALLLLATGPFRVQSPDWPAETSHLVDLAIRLTSRDREAPWPTCS